MLHADYFANPHYLLSTQRYAYESLEVVAFLDIYIARTGLGSGI